MNQAKWRVVLVVLVVMFFGVAESIQAQFRAKDPGVRGGPAGAGGPLSGLTTAEQDMFNDGLEDFSEEEGVADGVGPRFNFVGCAGCHMQPAVGGTSPAANPLFRVTGDLGFSGNSNKSRRSSRRTAPSAKRASSSTGMAVATVACTRCS